MFPLPHRRAAGRHPPVPEPRPETGLGLRRL